MGKRLLKIFFFTFLFILILALVTIVLHMRTNLISDSLRSLLNRSLSDVAEIEYSTLKGDLFQEIQLRDLRLRFHNGITLKTNKLDIQYSALASISGEFHFDEILIDSLTVIINKPKDDAQSDSTQNYQDFLTSMTEAGWYRDFISALPDIKIGALEIRNGQVEIPGKQMTISKIYLGLAGYVNPERIDVNIKKLTGHWLEKNLEVNDFGCWITGNPDRLTINQIRAKLPESQLYSSMDATFTEPGNYIISMEDVELELKDIAGLIDIPELDSSHIQLDCHIHGVPDNFNIELNLNGFVNEYPFEDFYIRGRYQKGNIDLDEGKLVAWQNKFFFKGEMSNRRNYLFARFKDFNVQDFLELSPKTNLNGSLYTNLNQLSLNPLTGRGKLELVNSVIDTVDIDSLRFELKADHNNLEIVEPSFLKFANSARFTVKGNVDEKYQANLQLSTENLDLTALSKSLKIDTLIGKVDANVFMTGDVFDPDVMGYVWVPHFEKDAIQLDSLILQIKIDQVLSSRQGDAYFSMTNSHFGPLVFREVQSDIIFDSNLVIIDTLFLANGANYISTSGQVITIEDTTELELKNFRIFYEQYWIDNSGPLIVHLDPQELLVEQAMFVAPDDGHLEIRGYWDREIDDIQTGLLVRNMHVKPFEQFAGQDVLLSGVIEGDLIIYDLLNETEVEIEIKAEDLNYNKVALGTIQSAFKFEDKKFYFDEFNLRHDSTLIDLDGDVVLELGGNNQNAGFELFEKSQADLKLTWQNVNLGNYMPLFKMSRPVGGIVNGEFNLSGSMKEPHGQIRLSGEAISYDKFYIDSTNASVQFDRDLITLEHLIADINGTLFRLSGTQEVNLDLTELDSNLVHMPLDLDIRCEDDTLEFIGFLTDQVERIHGPFSLDLKLRGTPANPRIDSGNIELNNGIIELSRVKNSITDVYLDAEFDQGVMTINEFSGYSEAEQSFLDRVFSVFDPLLQLLGFHSAPSGVISGSGTVSLKELAHPVIDLSFVMEQFFVDYFVENTQLILSSSNLHVTGRDTLLVTGDIEVSGKYVPDLDKLKKNLYLTNRDIKSSSRALGYDLKISMPGNFVITSSSFDFANNFKFEILGNLHVSQTPGDDNIEIIGPLEINSGNYGSWGQDFDIESGQIVFSDPKVINPDLDITAEKSSRGLTFLLSIRGNLEKQVLDLQVRDETNQYLNYTMSDKITLLTLGATSGQLSGSSLATAGEDVINTSVETAFSRGAESITGLDKVSIDMEGSMVDLQSMKLNNGLKDASLSLGKYIYSNLYLEYTSKMGGGTVPTPKLSWEPGNQIGLKYRINRNWSVNSDYSRTQRGNNLIQISLSWKTTF